MVSWIESHPTPIIAILVFGLCYALAAAIFAAASTLAGRPIGDELKTISPVTLTPLAVILGLLIAFLAARVWENASHAEEYIEQEASALSKALLFADALPPEVRTKVRAAVKQHVDFVVAQEWPAMANGRANRGTEPVALKSAIAALLSSTPAQPDQQLARARAVAAIEQAFEARRNRVRLSTAEIAPVQWEVVVALATLILVTTAMIHIGKPAAMGATLFIFASAVAASLVLLMVNDRPFAAGGVTLTPAAFREIVFD